MKLLLAGLCAFVLLCVLILIATFWTDAGYWIRYYDVEIIVAVVAGVEIGRLVYDWADGQPDGKGGAAWL